MDGAFLIDKPAGLSSHAVVAKLRKVSPGVRFGHAGTLDPQATGLLVLLAGRATRFQDVILNEIKEYSGTISFGVSTDTNDADGRVLERDEELAFLKSYSRQALLDEIKAAFSGRQAQLPPQISAVKVNGQRSYKLARGGAEVEHRAREVDIEFLELGFRDPAQLKYWIRCSKGTYVRSLARDIGAHFGSCAIAESIHRVASGQFRVEQASSLEKTLSGEGSFLELPELLGNLKRFFISQSEARALSLGQQQCLEILPRSETERYAIACREDGELIALLRQEPERGWKLQYVLCGN